MESDKIQNCNRRRWKKRKYKEKNELSRIKVAHMVDINLVILIITFKGNNQITTKIRVE